MTSRTIDDKGRYPRLENLSRACTRVWIRIATVRTQ